jgi:hypothetical protein
MEMVGHEAIPMDTATELLHDLLQDQVKTADVSIVYISAVRHYHGGSHGRLRRGNEWEVYGPWSHDTR